jgi:hypothetical protein
MDVRLPNGAVIKNVPEDMTRSQLIDKLRGKGYDVSGFEAKQPQVTGEVGFLESVRKSPAVAKLANIAERIAPSPEEVVAGMGEAALNLPESAVGMGAAGYELANLAMSPESWPKVAGAAVEAIPQTVHKGIMRAVTSPVEAIERAAQFAKKDPLGALSAVSGLTGGLGGLTGAADLAAVSRFTNPLAFPELAGKGIATGYEKFVSPIVSQGGAERAAANKLYESVMGRPEDVAAAFRQEPASIIGQVPASQRLAEARLYEPKLATLEADLTTGETAIGREALTREQQRLQAIQQQLFAIDQQIVQQGRAMSPEARAQLDEVRNSLLREQAAAQAAFVPREQAAGAMIPAVGQRAPGEAVAARAVDLRDTFRRDRIQPLYQAAFASAGNVTIPTRSIIQTAEDILGSRLADVPLGVANRTIRDLRRLERGATLEEIDRVRKSINKDIAAAQVSGKDLGDLHALHDAIDAAVDQSRIPTRAKLEYGAALDAYRTEFVPRFKTGVAYDVFRTTKKNQSGIIPSKTVEGFLANEDTASQFAATFGDDAIARNAMEQGILDMAHSPSAGIVETSGAVNPERIDDFLRKYERQFQTIGIDGERLLAPVRQQAEMLRAGRAELDREAAFFRTSTGEALRKGSDFVDVMLKDPAAMQAGLRRLSDAGRSALTKEIVDRAVRLIDKRTPEEALKYLTENKNAIRRVIDKPYYDRLIELTENQKALQSVEARATKPVVALDVDLSAVPPEVLTDFGMVAREIDRIEKASAMAGLRPSEPVKKIATADIEEAKRATSGFLDRKLNIMEKILDTAGRYLNRKTAAVLADVLTRDPAKAADLLEQAVARRTAVRPPESRARTLGRAAITGGIAAQNMLAPENQNAMSRQ